MKNSSFFKSLMISGLSIGLIMGSVPMTLPVSVAAEETETAPVTISEIVVSETSLVLKPNQSMKLKVTAIKSDGDEENITSNKNLKYRSSSNSTVAVLANGLIKAGKGTGTAIITYSYAGKQATLSVTVSNTKMKELKTSAKNLLVQVDETEAIELTAFMEDGTRKDVTDQAYWESSDKQIADVDRGEVIGREEGIAEITGSYGGKEIVVTVEVQTDVVKPLRIKIAEKNVKLVRGHSMELTVMGVYETSDGDIENEILDDIVWTTSKASVVNVSRDGVLTGIGVGVAKVTANYEGKIVSVNVEVKKGKDLKSVAANVKTVNIIGTEAKKVTVTAFYKDGTKEDVTTSVQWRSKQESIAVVDAGSIQGIAKGSTKVIGTFDGKSFSIDVNVQ
jgi:hypothetical protein